MARDVQPPDADQVRTLLRDTDWDDLSPVLQVFETNTSRKNKLIIFEQMLNHSAARRGADRLSSTSYGLSDAKRRVYFPVIEILVREEHERRIAEWDAEREELSRQITPEELEQLSDSELTLIDVILNEKISNRRKKLEILRLTYCSTRSSAFTTSVWKKWDSIAAADSGKVVDDVSQAIHKEVTRRDLDVNKVLNADT